MAGDRHAEPGINAGKQAVANRYQHIFDQHIRGLQKVITSFAPKVKLRSKKHSRKNNQSHFLIIKKAVQKGSRDVAMQCLCKKQCNVSAKSNATSLQKAMQRLCKKQCTFLLFPPNPTQSQIPPSPACPATSPYPWSISFSKRSLFLPWS